MIYKNSQMAGEARILKVVSTVTGLFALSLVVVTLALAPSPARPVALLVAGGTFALAIFMWTYAARPHLFSGDAKGILGDELRSTYTAPVAKPGAERTGAVSQHIYQWQSVRRVEAGEKVWTRQYTRMVLLQSLGLILGVATFALVVVGTTLGLGGSIGPVWMVAAALILAVGFNLSHRTGLVDATNYPTEPMQPMPDVQWHPVSAPVPGSPDLTIVPPVLATGTHAA
ncbi:hypothetical protein [Nocardioides nematodiphilus]|uniref:hypothetical protein n=1 Tax=Nocardioides nematodiphilus TaxID=2849669 RepID=UPI001CD92EF8|nr:hypothetical protein [Nocardioides nematodiphilus]MCA1982259.1 hypothetical protein [Nocardioides nematodiphilus]